MKSPSFIELSKSALQKNIRYLKKRVGKGTEIASVIKGNAYGHGINEFLPMAETCGIKYFCVSDAHEAEIAMKIKKKTSNIIIMYMIENSEIEWAIENDVQLYVFEFDRLNNAIEIAKRIKKKAKIHVEFETGMNRTGFNYFETRELRDVLTDNLDYIDIIGFSTHYAGAESIANYKRIMEQKDHFDNILNDLREYGLTAKYNHGAASAATLTYTEMQMDMVRVGIAQYGFWPSEETRMYNLLSDDVKFTVDPLKRVLRWVSTVMNIKSIPAGQFIGYGNSYLTTKETKIAIVPVGYSHGYSRSLSNLGHVLIAGKKAQIVGMVNMNMIIVDITNNNGVKKGDEVVLIGKQGKRYISVKSFSDLSNYVNYEMLTKLSAQIPRIVV